MASVSLRNVTKQYGSRAALFNLSLDVDSGELVVITGPAGSGKSTVLRLIAGLEEATSGEIYIDGKPTGGMSTRERDSVLVTREFPVYKKSMTVYDNLAYGLRQRKADENVVKERIEQAARLFGISHILKEKASSLDEATLRRIALARGAVRRPQVMLIDDPLGGLDEKDRIQMMTDIVKLQSHIGSAIICAAGEPSDAMTLGTRVVVLKDGYPRQTDTPKNLYDDPADTFVAMYLGETPINLFTAYAKKNGEAVEVRLGLGEVCVTLPASRAKRMRGIGENGCEVLMGVRAEDFHDEQRFTEASPDTVVEARIRLNERLGGQNILYLDIDGKSDFAVARVDARTPLSVGDRVRLAIDYNRVHLFDRRSGRSLCAVPQTNFIPCKMIANENGGLVARFGLNSLELPESVTSRLTDRAAVNGDVLLGISPSDIDTEYHDGRKELDAEADFIIRRAGFTSVYAKVSGVNGFVVVNAPKDCPECAGEKIKLYVDSEKLQIYDASGRRITAVRPVTNNVANAAVSIKGRTATAVVGKNKYTFDAGLNFKSGACNSFRIPPKAVSIAGGGAKNTVKAVVLDSDFLGDTTLLYLRLDGFEPYFTAAVNGYADCKIGDKIKLAVDTGAITNEEIKPLGQYIKDSAADAPAYVYEEEE